MSKVHAYDDQTPGAWEEFLQAMHSGQPFECDETMFDYWLEVLPPIYMGCTVELPDGRKVKAAFGFAEGAELITAFWTEKDGDRVRFFGCRTTTMNPHG